MMVAAERAPWQNPKIVTTLMVVFLAGAATGAASMQLGLHRILHRTPVSRPAPQGREAILNQFKTQLELSEPQAEKLALVLDDYRQYYQSLQDQLDDLRATGKNRILAILDDGQKQKFEKMMTDLGPQLTGK